ncbi:MAG: hypothetical protein R3E31_07535 [Chloroflexota bacterium]
MWRTRFGNGKQPLPRGQRQMSHSQSPLLCVARWAAGILLLDAQENGWLFLTVPQRRQAVWWRWQDGAAVTAIREFHSKATAGTGPILAAAYYMHNRRRCCCWVGAWTLAWMEAVFVSPFFKPVERYVSGAVCDAASAGG